MYLHPIPKYSITKYRDDLCRMQWLYEIQRYSSLSILSSSHFSLFFLTLSISQVYEREDLFSAAGATYYELRRNPMPNWSSSCHSHRIIRLLGPPLLWIMAYVLFLPLSCPPPDLPQPPRANPCFSIINVILIFFFYLNY